MPYVIRPYKKTAKFRVCKRNSKKCFSKRPMTKRNANRQLAAIYANSGERHLRLVGGKELMSTRTSRVAKSALSDKDRAAVDVNAAVDRFKTILGNYSPLALCHFIKTNKSLIFDTSSSDGVKKTKYGDIDKKAIHTMKKYYKLLNIDSVTSDAIPEHPLTPDKFKQIVSSLFSTRRLSSSAPRIFQKGGQERPNRLLRNARFYFLGVLWCLAIGISGLLIQKLILEQIIVSRCPFNAGYCYDDRLIRPGDTSIILEVAIALAMMIFPIVYYEYFPGDDPHEVDRAALLDFIEDDEDDIAHLINSPGPANTFRIIRRNSDMPAVPENLNMCGICQQLLVESDANEPRKNIQGYVVQMHPGQGPVPHLYHFKCIRMYFLSQIRQRLPTQCLVDEIGINGYELLRTTDITAHVDGKDFF